MTYPKHGAPPVGHAGGHTPAGRVLSNGRWTTVLTHRGTGYAECGGRRLTAWSGDPVEDREGAFVYFRDRERGAAWSLGRAPIAGSPDVYDVRFSPGRMRIRRVEHDLDVTMEAVVACDADAELRRIMVRNASTERRRIEVTTYAEVVLHDAAAHASHPAFSKLFVQTAVDGARGVLTAVRRPRGVAPMPLVLAHAFVGDGALEWETDRARFIGRGRTLADPAALYAPLSGSTGSVLDPVLALRRTVEIDPGGQATLLVIYACGATVAHAVDAALRYGSAEATEGVFVGAEERARELLDSEGLDESDGEYLQALAVALRYGAPELRADAAVVRRAMGPRTRLGALGVTGKSPLVVVGPGPQQASLERASRYWEALRLPAEVLRLGQDIDSALADVARAAAAMVLGDTWPVLGRGGDPGTAQRERATAEVPPGVRLQGDPTLVDPNGWGAFTSDGRAYVMDVSAPAGARPPMPWTNVIANPRIGCVVSESGAACTWSRNSREHRLTPWSNDPVIDPHGEALYVRDDASGAFWSPQPGPAGGGEPYRVEHAFGRSTWWHVRDGLRHETTTFVAATDAVRLTRVRITNDGGERRQLSVFAYWQLVLGVQPTDAPHAVATVCDASAGLVLATNGLRDAALRGTVIAAVVGAKGGARSATCDRRAFLGSGGSPADPAGVHVRGLLPSVAGTGLDPCAALQVVLEIDPGESAACTFLLGDVGSGDDARELVARYDDDRAVGEALRDACEAWSETLTRVQVRTPSPAIDRMVNGWLGYQTLGCRLWGRSAFQQSGGAFGFRDQLQDTAALVWMRPDLTREQLLLHAAHQFPEGDVLHWWHPPTDRGTRTRFADDLLWLPYLTAFYVSVTGDDAVLSERVGFVQGRLLEAGEDEAYLDTTTSAYTASLYEHCRAAIERSLAVGAHGLPLMGTGDWNDGMNLVGRAGRGESVWMGFFLYAILEGFEPHARVRGDDTFADRWAEHRQRLAEALDRDGWDGAWYRRAWFDDGSVLGSADCDECRIDVLPQAWAVMSGAVARERAVRAMDSAWRELLLDPPGMLCLLAPPFDRTAKEPGYIKGYVPGVRENGGQYTHAALWAVRALAEIDRRDDAVRLLEMLTPLHHARDAATTAVYRAEPYVVAADVYSAPEHLGRGGWTWYTGSAGWMLRVALESVLGFGIVGGTTLRLRPRVPDGWPAFEIDYRLPDGRARYEIRVENPSGAAASVRSVTVDGTPGAVAEGAALVPIVRDGGVHRVVLVLGAESSSPPGANT